LDIKDHVSEKLIETVYENLSKKLDKKYHYHNLIHTKRVISSAINIGSHYNLSDSGWKILLTSCLLHDYGFLYSHIDHEEKGSEIAKSILPSYGFNDNHIKSVQKLILITKVDAKPTNLLESIIRDSDLEYLGSNEFKSISENLKKEWIDCGVVADDSNFYDAQLKFLNAHNFYTDYMNKECKANKEANINYAEMMNKS